jgi:FkbM family methyltransferase
MKFDFIEIGTCDFDTLLQSTSSKIGLSIDPIKIYLDNLPDNDHVIKLNCAISDKDGEVEVFWISPDDIHKYQLPVWLKGCNSIINPHPSAIKELRDRNLDNIYIKSKCKSMSWKSLVELYDIKQVDYLKIDTEGHDCFIINNILDFGKVLPNRILFENNVLSEQSLVEETLARLNKFGYFVKSRDFENFTTDAVILVERNENLNIRN